MTLSELLDHFRDLASDTELPYLWSDREVYRYVDQAQNSFVKVFGGFRDNTGPMTQLVLPANQLTVPFDSRILRILKAVNPITGPVDVLNATDYRTDYIGSDYAKNTAITNGAVRWLIIGETENTLRPIGTPLVDTLLVLSVMRLPLRPIVDSTSILEVRPDHVPYLVHGMLELAYLKDDPDTYQPGRSEKQGKRFDEYALMVKSELNARNRVAKPVTYGGI